MLGLSAVAVESEMVGSDKEELGWRTFPLTE